MQRAGIVLTGLALLLSACGSSPTAQLPTQPSEQAVAGASTLNAQAVAADTPWTGCAPINIAQDKPAIASSTEQSWLGPQNAVDDNDYRTRWSSEFNDQQWIQVDLGRSFYVCSVLLKWENSAAYGKDYEVQVSDDAQTWTPIYRTTGRTGCTDVLRPVGNVAGRYVRMQGLARGTGYGYSLFDFQVYPAGGDVITAPAPKPATYTGSLSGSTDTTWAPGEAGFTYGGGTLTATLTHDSTMSLFLQRQQGIGWVTVARDTGFNSTNPANIKRVTYTATSGTYRWMIYSTGTGGKYSLTEQR